MLGEQLLNKFSEYDVREVDDTFTKLTVVCAKLSKLGRGTEVARINWLKLYNLSEDIDFLFIEDD